MRLKISHHSEYRYDAPVGYALQRLRLIPKQDPVQTVHGWDLSIEGAREEVRFRDQFANETVLISAEGGRHAISVEAHGEVETRDTAGVVGEHRGFAPLWLFRRETALTKAGPGVARLVEAMGAASDVERLHTLMAAIADTVAYQTGTTDAETPAEEAIKRGTGVCQDHAHIFVSAARRTGYPARYVSGYLHMDGTDLQAASHAWAEVHVDGLGWVGFDPANRVSPDERYVRVATGLDYRDACPISGIRHGSGEELLAVRVTVEQ
ncbi:MAG: transglutaminase family protein [Roseitalea porphyridii]|uniref:transglutaminase family protein n=1 Tax=Roseitalea porphyridii TaxID=1852022 RepID=UPI0032EF4D25